jgi:thioredoxin-related protein
MKKIMLLSFMSVMSFALFAKTSTPQGFTDDFDAALEASKKSGKTVFAVFSGSDWCYWCKVLEENYLSKKEFVDEASKNFELVYIDYPRDKGLLSEKALKRNPELVKKYGIRGFPTVKFIDSNAAASVAPRPAKGLTPKAYAQELVKRLKSKP